MGFLRSAVCGAIVYSSSTTAMAATGDLRFVGSCQGSKDGFQSEFHVDDVTNTEATVHMRGPGPIFFQAKIGLNRAQADIAIYKHKVTWSHYDEQLLREETLAEPAIGDVLHIETHSDGVHLSCHGRITNAPTVRYSILSEPKPLAVEQQRIKAMLSIPGFHVCGLKLGFDPNQVGGDLNKLPDALEVTTQQKASVDLQVDAEAGEILIITDSVGWSDDVNIETVERRPLRSVIREIVFPYHTIVPESTQISQVLCAS